MAISAITIYTGSIFANRIAGAVTISIEVITILAITIYATTVWVVTIEGHNYIGSIFANLIAGAVAEAGASQAGDLMQVHN